MVHHAAAAGHLDRDAVALEGLDLEATGAHQRDGAPHHQRDGGQVQPRGQRAAELVE